jgi:hypothetical protein
MMQHSFVMDEATRPPGKSLSRRRVLQLGLGASVLMTLGGAAAWSWQPGWQDGRLTDSGRAVFRAVARAVLEGSLPADGAARDAALEAHLDRLGTTLAGFPRASRNEVAQLLGILSIAPGRRWLAGLAVDWTEASTIAVDQALRSMRQSDRLLRQQAYHALRDLTNAAFYAQPEHWSLIGYPGPVAV